MFRFSKKRKIKNVQFIFKHLDPVSTLFFHENVEVLTFRLNQKLWLGYSDSVSAFSHIHFGNKDTHCSGHIPGMSSTQNSTDHGHVRTAGEVLLEDSTW